jgi:hypothetical protein
MLLASGQLEHLSVDELTMKTLTVEDRRAPESIEDPQAIAAALGL